MVNISNLGQNTQREFSLVMKHGVEAKNYDDIAKAEHLKPLEVGEYKLFFNIFFDYHLHFTFFLL